jgi:hypothetical protein
MALDEQMMAALPIQSLKRTIDWATGHRDVVELVRMVDVEEAHSGILAIVQLRRKHRQMGTAQRELNTSKAIKEMECNKPVCSGLGAYSRGAHTWSGDAHSWGGRAKDRRPQNHSVQQYNLPH